MEQNSSKGVERFLYALATSLVYSRVALKAVHSYRYILLENIFVWKTIYEWLFEIILIIIIFLCSSRFVGRLQESFIMNGVDGLRSCVIIGVSWTGARWYRSWATLCRLRLNHTPSSWQVGAPSNMDSLHGSHTGTLEKPLWVFWRTP